MADLLVDSLQTDSVMAIAEQAKMAAEEGNYQEALHTVIQKGVEMTVGLASRIVLAVVVYLVLSWVIRKINRFVEKALEKRNAEPTLTSFVKSLSKVVLNFIMIIVVISILGIETSSFVALFASAGVAIGMALSGTLQNFAGGVMIMLFKPFKVSDFIEAQGMIGIVKEIQIFNTILVTLDNKTIILPNGNLSTGVLTNYSKEATRRVDFEFTISYGDDYDKAKSVLMNLIQNNPKIIKDEEGKKPFVALSKLDSSSVNIVVRVWVLSADYWDVYFQMNEDVYKTFAKEGLNIPFPQMDVHVHQA